MLELFAGFFIAAVFGFGIGFGVREWISRERRRRYATRRWVQDTQTSHPLAVTSVTASNTRSVPLLRTCCGDGQRTTCIGGT
jgi:hypothetical protein